MSDTVKLEHAPYVVVFTPTVGPACSACSMTIGKMLDYVCAQKGYLGRKIVKSKEGLSQTRTYWDSLASIKAWKDYAEAELEQSLGSEHWHEHFDVEICETSLVS